MKGKGGAPKRIWHVYGPDKPGLTVDQVAAVAGIKIDCADARLRRWLRGEIADPLAAPGCSVQPIGIKAPRKRSTPSRPEPPSAEQTREEAENARREAQRAILDAHRHGGSGSALWPRPAASEEPWPTPLAAILF